MAVSEDEFSLGLFAIRGARDLGFEFGDAGTIVGERFFAGPELTLNSSHTGKS